MDRFPETRYVAVGDADVAYQVLGEGPIDLLYFYGLGSHLEMCWYLPEVAEFLDRLASFSRLIYFDRRGTGASDGVPRNAIPTWEEWTADVEAVLDAAGSERAAILAAADAGPVAVLFAAMHPERVSALVLVNTSARYPVADDYPAGAPPEALEAMVEMLGGMWGTPDLIAVTDPSMAGDPEYLQAGARMARAAATPRTARAQYDYILRSLDVRHVLPHLQVPTLVMNVTDSPIVSADHGRYLAEHVPGARFLEVPGGDIYASTPGNYAIATEVAQFLTGEASEIEVQRRLSTMLFTDIVGSTERAASMGDQRWSHLLDAHDRAIRDQLRRLAGKEIATAGDGFFAAFDGPGRAIRCAKAIVAATSDLGLELRAGLHTGEVEVRGDTLGGLAVHIAARVGALAAPKEVLVSRTVKDLVVGSGIEFADRGSHQLKGVPGTWDLFAVAN